MRASMQKFFVVVVIKRVELRQYDGYYEWKLFYITTERIITTCEHSLKLLAATDHLRR